MRSSESRSSSGDGQVSSTKQTADVEAAISRGVNGIVISPNEVDAMAPALQEAVDAKIPVVTIDRYVTKVPDLLGHVGADNSKGGEAQAELILKLFPNGAKIMTCRASPAPARRSTATRACTRSSTSTRTSIRSCSSRPPSSTA